LSNNDLFNILETPESITITFSSTMENIDRTCDETIRFLMNFFKGLNCPEGADRYKYLKNHLFSIQLVMREGLTNAVRHGNCLNARKTVKCSVQMNQNQVLRMEIEDQGEGFDWKKEQLREVDTTGSAEHGRGLLIMEQYFSRYWYNDIGNRLVLEKLIYFK